MTERPLAAAGVEEAGLGEAEGEGDGALLGAGGEAGGGYAVEEEGDVVAVGPLEGHAGGSVAGDAAAQRFPVSGGGAPGVVQAVRGLPVQPRPGLPAPRLYGRER